MYLIDKFLEKKFMTDFAKAYFVEEVPNSANEYFAFIA